MTVQQHAPRLAHVGPHLAIPSALLIAIGAVIVVAIVAVGAWALLQPTAISAAELEMLRKLELLRETIPGGGFI
jgi:hypothetical protein